MNRSTGVTVSAVLVFIGSGLTVVFGGLFGFVTLLVPEGPAQSPFVRYVLAFSIVMYAAFGIWGIASGIGLLRLRQWARISVLVFSGILLFFTVPVLIMLPFLPMPRLEGSGNIVLAIKLGMSFFYGTIAAIGGGWLYFFNRRSVKEQFRRQPEAVLLTSAEAIIPASSPSRRPLSIGIIGWILVVGSCFALPMVLFRLPMFILGFPLTGWRASLTMLIWCVVQGAAGVGLLKLQSWGRTLAICLFLFGLLNCTVLVLVPGVAARFAQANAEMQSRMGLPTTGQGTFAPEMTHFFLWFGAIFGAAFTVLQLWFVVTRKQAFTATNEVPAISP